MKGKMVTVGVRITAEENEKLERLGRDTFRKKSDLIRLGLSMLFEKEEELKEVEK